MEIQHFEVSHSNPTAAWEPSETTVSLNKRASTKSQKKYQREKDYSSKILPTGRDKTKNYFWTRKDPFVPQSHLLFTNFLTIKPIAVYCGGV